MNTLKSQFSSLAPMLIFVSISTMMLGSLAKAGTILIDDFNDGNDDGWTHMDSNIGHPWGPGIYDASSGAYRLSTTGTVPGNGAGRGFMVSRWDESSTPAYSNGFMRCKFRIDTFDATAVLLFRYSGDINSGLNGYSFVGDAGRGFFFNRIVDTSLARVINLGGPAPEVGEEWWMEGGAVGDDFSMKVWRVGRREPTSPQISFKDSAFSSGWIGLDANMNFGSTISGMVDTTFDDVYFKPVPEPGSLLPLVLCLFASLGPRRRSLCLKYLQEQAIANTN